MMNMKKTGIGLVIVILIQTFSFSQTNGTEQITIPLSRPEETGVLRINHYKGAIRVAGYDGNQVVVQASLRHPGAEDRDDGLKRISSNALKLSGIEAQNTVTVTTNSHERTIDLVVYVPRRFSLRIQNSDNGDITVQEVFGEMEVNNVNGSIEMLNIGGSVVSSTVDGDIRILFKEVAHDAPMAFSTLEGTIDVTFPSDVHAFVKMKSDYGDVFSDFDMQIRKRKEQTERTEQGEVYRVFLEEWTYGTINGGGPEFLFTTVNGNIFIRQQFE